MAFQQNVHNFRAFAILGVVGAHSLQNFSWESGSLLFICLDTLFNQSTIWFAFIAGYLFQALSGRYQTGSYYRKKIVNVLTPYVLCSIPALVVAIFFIPQEMPAGFGDYGAFKQALLFLVTGKHLAPYWYIPMITVIFVLAPLLIFTDRHPRLYWALLLLIPLSGYLGRDGLLIHTALPPYFSQLSKAVYLLSPYLFGMLCSRYHETLLATVSRHWVLLLIASISLFGLEVTYYHETTYLMFAFKMVSAPLILWSLRREFGGFQSSLDRIASWSFGIFFIHGYVLGLTSLVVQKSTGAEDFSAANPVTYILFYCTVVLASLGCIYLVKKIVGDGNSTRLIGC